MFYLPHSTFPLFFFRINIITCKSYGINIFNNKPPLQQHLLKDYIIVIQHYYHNRAFGVYSNFLWTRYFHKHVLVQSIIVSFHNSCSWDILVSNCILGVYTRGCTTRVICYSLHHPTCNKIEFTMSLV